MFTNGNDVFFMQVNLQQLTTTLVNPYSNFSIFIDEEKNVNDQVLDGLDGFDRFIGTNFGDAVFIDTAVMQQVVSNIEVFIAGDGGDVIALASDTSILGDVIISGGAGDDILWANIGNDVITGFDGNDIIDGGPGNDDLRGENDDDQIFGGEGDDILNGGNGNDILYGGTDLGLMELDKDFIDNITFPELVEGTDISNLIPPGTPALGINSDNLTVSYDASATLTFREGFAGYNNTLGVYNIAEDGTIEMASILWENTKTAGIDVEHSIDLPVGVDGGQFGFFIIANGDRVNSGYNGLDDILEQGAVRFVYDYGGAGERAAKIDDDGNLVSIVYDDGTVEQALSGYHYHTTPRGDTPDINWDGQTHAVSGLLDLANQDVLRIGFEDLPNLGDADYEDVLFDLDIDRIHVDASEVGNDTLIGGAGNDMLYGEAGDDILVIGNGFDQAYGGSGADTFQFDIGDALADKIFDFDASEGDILDISGILVGYDPLSDAIEDFVSFVDNGGDTEVHVNADGDAGGVFTSIAVFDGGITDTVNDLITNGNMIV